ncbi:protein EXECUTER 1, chloroplastic [Oryza brachyantha]|nr:protein EXECUTER 1, chloroplastic [Oryza brachyantha]XP_040384234.1 protein EXECUTER 1, chloroplastic [Oryza brachyantha]XP_040384235.1 protein EXECUTER 1, chloroplastic [Oryza brachyantha]XP_040384236.1 protein EXECUTER 1, chloroplastic [Oryza brachyantha]
MAAASVSTAPRAPLPGAVSSCSASSSSSSLVSRRQWDPSPSGFLAARRGHRVRRLAGAAPAPRDRRASSVVRCGGARSPDADGGGERRRGWDALFHDALQGAVRRWSEYVGSYWPLTPPGKGAGLGKRVEKFCEGQVRGEEEEEREVEGEEGKWSWERWKQHFALIEESERLVDELQLQLQTAVYREDFRSAHKLKLAIAATSKNDTVGRAISDLNSAIQEERYMDAAYIRDHAGAGLLGWWSGISGNLSDPYGLIIHISAEHGRYVAKSYDTRQLNSDGPGFPIFEIYFAEENGGYHLQAVHLKPEDSDSQQLPNMLREKLDMDSINISSTSFGAKHEDHNEGINMDDQNNDDSDVSAGPAGFKNLPSDSTPVPRVKILKVVPMENVNQDYIIKIFDQMSDEDDDNDNPEVENDSSEDIGDGDNIEVAEAASGEDDVDETGDESDIEALISIDFITEDDKDFTSSSSTESFERMPARLERRDRFAFSFYTDQYSKKQDVEKVQQTSKERVGPRTTQQDDDYLQFDRVKLVGSNRKLSVLQLGIKQHNNKVQQNLYGVTHFSRIQMPISLDPLTGLYMTASGFDSEILSLQRKFGQWREDDSSDEHRDLQFYEYVEAVKLTGDNLVPAGQVVFRAKVGNHYQLPHKGIIPRELGVVARYKGERRIADPGFQNPRWVDGELLVLDGKFIRDGPVIAFFYWTSNFHLFEFFRRLKLPD